MTDLTPEKIDAALASTKSPVHIFGFGTLSGFELEEIYTTEICETIRTALRLAKRLMDEPNDAMSDTLVDNLQFQSTYFPSHGYSLNNPVNLFKAMRDQLIKEVEQTK